MQGPFTIELGVHFRVGPDTVAVAKLDLPPGYYPTREDIETTIKAAEVQVLEQCPEARLLDRHEFENQMIAERTGVTMTFATRDRWDTDEEVATARASAAHTKRLDED